MTSEVLGEMFGGDSADTCAEKVPLVSLEGEATCQVCADRERGPPLAPAEFVILSILDVVSVVIA